MIRFRAFPFILLLGTVANASVLPLRPGTYVLADASCRDPALAAMFTYDGRHFSYPHASACRSVTLSRTKRTYRVKETCAAEGDGTVAVPSTTVSTYEIRSATQVRVGTRNGGTVLAYRWCAAK